MSSISSRIGCGANLGRCRRSRETRAFRFAGEVERGAVGREDCARLRTKPAHDGSADHSGVAWGVNALVREVEQGHLWGFSHAGSCAPSRSAQR